MTRLGLTDAPLEIVDRPDDLDEQRLERPLGQFMVRHVGPGLAPDVQMFTDFIRIVSELGLAVPPGVAAVFRALATLGGTLTQLAPGFDVVAEARGLAVRYFAEQLRPEALRRAATDELTTLLSMLRTLPRRLDRVTASLERGRLSVNVRLLADAGDRQMITGWLNRALTAFLAASTGIMAVLKLGLRGGPTVTSHLNLNQIFGYCLLVIGAILALRVLVLVFRPANASSLSCQLASAPIGSCAVRARLYHLRGY